MNLIINKSNNNNSNKNDNSNNEYKTRENPKCSKEPSSLLLFLLLLSLFSPLRRQRTVGHHQLLHSPTETPPSSPDLPLHSHV